MATKPLKTVGRKKPPSAVETSRSIEIKVNAFLEAGGKIEQIKSGVSGQQSMARPKLKSSETTPTEPNKAK